RVVPAIPRFAITLHQARRVFQMGQNRRIDSQARADGINQDFELPRVDHERHVHKTCDQMPHTTFPAFAPVHWRLSFFSASASTCSDISSSVIPAFLPVSTVRASES